MALEDFVSPAAGVIAIIIAVVAAVEALKADRSIWWVFAYIMLAALAIFLRSGRLSFRASHVRRKQQKIRR